MTADERARALCDIWIDARWDEEAFDAIGDAIRSAEVAAATRMRDRCVERVKRESRAYAAPCPATVLCAEIIEHLSEIEVDDWR